MYIYIYVHLFANVHVNLIKLRSRFTNLKYRAYRTLSIVAHQHSLVSEMYCNTFLYHCNALNDIRFTKQHRPSKVQICFVFQEKG